MLSTLLQAITLFATIGITQARNLPSAELTNTLVGVVVFGVTLTAATYTHLKLEQMGAFADSCNEMLMNEMLAPSSTEKHKVGKKSKQSKPRAAKKKAKGKKGYGAKPCIRQVSRKNITDAVQTDSVAFIKTLPETTNDAQDSTSSSDRSANVFHSAGWDEKAERRLLASMGYSDDSDACDSTDSGNDSNSDNSNELSCKCTIFDCTVDASDIWAAEQQLLVNQELLRERRQMHRANFARLLAPACC